VSAATVLRFKVVLPPGKGQEASHGFYVGTAERVDEDQVYVHCRNVQVPRGFFVFRDGQHVSGIVGLPIASDLKFRKSDLAVLTSPLPIPAWFRTPKPSGPNP
jgi:hypothetical protein